MQKPQVLVYEMDGRVAESLRGLATKKKWLLREPRKADGCLRLLQRGGPQILIVKVGRSLEREFDLLEQATRLHPDTPTLVMLDTDQPGVAGLAWDLGAAYVVTAQQPRERLEEVLVSLMDTFPEQLLPAGEVKLEWDETSTC